MSGERSSTARQRGAGQICCSCKSWLPAPHVPGEQYCAHCRPPLKIVYASFEEKGATWEVIMYDSGTQRQIRKLRFEDSNKLIEMARRGQGLGNLEAKQALDYGIDHGKGGMFLKLTPEQYEALKRIRP